MAIPSFYNAADQELYKDYQFVPQEKYRTGFTAPTTEEEITETFGIPNTNAFTNSGGANFNSAGNAFGYGNKVSPVALGSYDDPSYFGGLPGNVQQYGLPRNFMYDMDPNYKGNEFMTAYQMTTGKNKELPGFANFGLSFLPFGNFIRNKIEKGLNDPRVGQPNYRIGGMDNTQKGLYNALAGEQMLFDGPGGVKTLTGKNFTGKGYLEGQIELAKGFGFDTMTDEEIAAEIAKTKANPRKQFKYKQMLEASTMYKTNKAQEEKAAEEEAKKTGEGYTGTPGGNTGSGDFANIDNSGKNYGPYSNNNNNDYSNKGGGASYSSSASTGAKDGFGYGLADGGRIGFQGGGRDAGKDSDFGSEDLGGNDSPKGPAELGLTTKTPNPNDNPERTTIIQKIKNNPFINNPITRFGARVGLYVTNPSLMGLDYRTASQLKGVYDKATDLDDEDVTMNKYKQGGRVNFKNGGLASIL